MSLKGKTILITGASRGIGRAIALRFASERAKRLVLVGRDGATLSGVRRAALAAFRGADGDVDVDVDVEVKSGDVKEGGFWTGVGKEMVCYL